MERLYKGIVRLFFQKRGEAVAAGAQRKARALKAVSLERPGESRRHVRAFYLTTPNCTKCVVGSPVGACDPNVYV
jgi:hypothetical protein